MRLGPEPWFLRPRILGEPTRPEVGKFNLQTPPGAVKRMEKEHVRMMNSVHTKDFYRNEKDLRSCIEEVIPELVTKLRRC